VKKKIRASLSEKILFFFLIFLGIFSLIFFMIIKNKCLFVEKIDLNKIKFSNPQNIVIMNIECGNVIIELFPRIITQRL